MTTAIMNIEDEPGPLPNQFFIVCANPVGFFKPYA